MAKLSAGLLMFRRRKQSIEVLLVHPGGPYWAKKDDGAWSIPKGEYGSGEEPLGAARREFKEETGMEAAGPFLPLPTLLQRSGKNISAWAFEGDCDPAQVRSNTFSLEWPPKSGRIAEFPEVDRACWFSIEAARVKLLTGQRPWLDALTQLTAS
jgi:predicted NUDIX family NTP pyrophosphohydrolase